MYTLLQCLSLTIVQHSACIHTRGDTTEIDGVGMLVILHLEWGQVVRLLQLECLANQAQVRKHFQHCLSGSSWSQIGQKNDSDADDAPVSPLSTDVDGPINDGIG